MVIYRFRLYKLMSHVYGVWAVGVQNFTIECPHVQRQIQDFKLGAVDFKKLRRVEGGPKIFGVFCVKNFDFTPKNHIFSNCGGRREIFGVFRVKNHDFTPKNHIFFNFRGDTCRMHTPPPLDPPPACGSWVVGVQNFTNQCPHVGV